MSMRTSVDSEERLIKVGLNIFRFGILEWVDNMGHRTRNLKMVKSRGCGYYCFDGVFLEDGLIGCRVEIPNKQSTSILGCLNHDIATFVFLLACKIIKHNNYNL